MGRRSATPAANLRSHVTFAEGLVKQSFCCSATGDGADVLAPAILFAMAWAGQSPADIGSARHAAVARTLAFHAQSLRQSSARRKPRVVAGRGNLGKLRHC